MKLQNMRWRAVNLAGSSIVMGLAVLSGCNGGGSGGLVNNATPTPSPSPTPVPTGAITVTVFSTSGNFSRATGSYTQTSGSFDRLSGTLLPPVTPGPSPSPEPTSTPDPAAEVVVYVGTYNLDSGGAGEFIFTSLPGNTGDGVGAPPELFRFQGTPETVESGAATVTLQINGSTGTGTIQLSNNDRGTISISSINGSGGQAQAMRKRLAKVQAMRAKALKR